MASGKAYNSALMSQELNLERQRAVAARDRARREGKLINSTSTCNLAVATAAASVTTTIPNPTAGLSKSPIRKASRIFGVSAPILQGALIGALPAVAIGLATAYNASPEERINVWKETVINIVKGMGLGGTAGYLVDKVSRALIEFGTKMSDKAWLGTCAKSLKGFASTIAFAAVDVGYQGIRYFYHLICYHWAKQQGDQETVEIETEEMEKILSIDNACVLLAHVLTQAASTSAGAWIAASGLGAISVGAAAFVTLAFPACAILIADATTKAMLDRKNGCGGWSPYLRSFFMKDRRTYHWGGEEYEKRYREVPSELECEINHTLLVDPVRSTFTGTLYERSALFRWLDEYGDDPYLRGEKATRLDYIPAPMAKKWAHICADTIGAQLIPDNTEGS